MVCSSLSGTLLLEAAGSGSKDIVEAVVTALEKKLNPAEVIVEGFTSVGFRF